MVDWLGSIAANAPALHAAYRGFESHPDHWFFEERLYEMAKEIEVADDMWGYTVVSAVSFVAGIAITWVLIR